MPVLMAQEKFLLQTLPANLFNIDENNNIGFSEVLIAKEQVI
jgi:hypothetical protein